MDGLTTESVAERLGVSTRRVRALIEQGDLDAERVGRVHLVSAESVARLAASRDRGRALSRRMSWAVLLSNVGTTGLNVVTQSFGLSRSDRQRVRALQGRAIEDWTWLARRRASTTRHVVRDLYVDRLLGDSRVLRSGLSALAEHDVKLSSQATEAEVYVAEGDRDDLLIDYMARPDSAGRVIVHAVEGIVLAHGRASGATVMTAMTVAVDLAESTDRRTRRAGHELVARITGG